MGVVPKMADDESSENIRFEVKKQFLLNPSEMDRYLLEFQGGSSPLLALGSCREGAGGGRRGRDGSKLRRSNTSPRKKGSPSVTWSSGGSFREGQYRKQHLGPTLT